MSYKINIGSIHSLKVCVGKFDTFEEAKDQMLSYIIELIERQKSEDDRFDSWENFIEDFPEEIRDILNNFEENGWADFDDYISDDDGNISYTAYESQFEASGKPDSLGYSLEICTNAINMYDPNENYRFELTEKYNGGSNMITIELLVNDGAVDVYNVIPDETLSLLTPIDY